MRIIGGTAAGRPLKVPKGFDVRPTPDLVRQALFNSLGSRVENTRVLELFAGTGALCLECLSRGATQAACVEKSAKHADFIRDNFLASGLARGSLEIQVQDAFAGMAKMAAAGRQFELIMADPPYGEKNINRRSTSLAQKMLDDPNLLLLLAPGGLIVIGHTKRDTLSLPETLEETKLLKHGDTLIRFLQRK